MATFIGGSGAVGLGNDIGGIAVDNGCYELARGSQVSMWEMWNLVYYFGTDFSSPYNFGFFYGQGCPGLIVASLNFYVDPYNESTAAYGYYYTPYGNTETLIATLDNYGTTCSSTTVRVNTKFLGQGGNDVFLGIRKTGSPYTGVQYDRDQPGCPDTNNGDYGGTYDYPGSCPGQFIFYGLQSATSNSAGLTANVDKSGYFVTC